MRDNEPTTARSRKEITISSKCFDWSISFKETRSFNEFDEEEVKSAVEWINGYVSRMFGYPPDLETVEIKFR